MQKKLFKIYFLFILSSIATSAAATSLITLDTHNNSILKIYWNLYGFSKIFV
jgi:hypothetical protein